MVIDDRKIKDVLGLYDGFYGSPDGTDCLQKTYYYTKYGGIGGGILSIYEMIIFSKPATVYGALGRFGRFSFPCAGMGFVFGSSICVLGQLRKKDDVANHVIAGVAAGTVWGMKYRSIGIGHTWGIFLGAIAGIYKYYKVNNFDPFRGRGAETDFHHPALDFTIKIYDDPGRPSTA